MFTRPYPDRSSFAPLRSGGNQSLRPSLRRIRIWDDDPLSLATSALSACSHVLKSTEKSKDSMVGASSCGGYTDFLRFASSPASASAAAHARLLPHRLVSASSSSRFPPPPITPPSEPDEGQRGECAAEQLHILTSLLSRPPRPFSSAAVGKLPLPRGGGGGGASRRRAIRMMEPPPKSGAMRQLRRRQRQIAVQIAGVEGEAEVGIAADGGKHVFARNAEGNHAIRALAEAGMDEEAQRLADEQVAEAGGTAAAIALGHAFAGRLPLAVHHASIAARSGLPLPDLHCLYAHLILLASRHHRHDIVRAFLAELGASPRLFLSLRNCTSVMSACRKSGLYEAVMALFRWWKGAGYWPNPVMYEIVITSLSAMGKHRDALGIYWEMEEAGCSPDLQAYAALLEACAAVGDSSKAIRLFSRMKEAGIAVHRGMYSSLVEACRKDGRLGKARELSAEANRLLMDIC